MERNAVYQTKKVTCRRGGGTIYAKKENKGKKRRHCFAHLVLINRLVSRFDCIFALLYITLCMQWPTERMSQTCGIFSGGHCNTVWYILHCVKWVGWKCSWNGKRSLKKGGATLIRPSSTNFTAVFYTFCPKEWRFVFIEKYEKDDIALPI